LDSIVAGQNKDFDITLALISVTEPRKKVVDFSTPCPPGRRDPSAVCPSAVWLP